MTQGRADEQYEASSKFKDVELLGALGTDRVWLAECNHSIGGRGRSGVANNHFPDRCFLGFFQQFRAVSNLDLEPPQVRTCHSPLAQLPRHSNASQDIGRNDDVPELLLPNLFCRGKSDDACFHGSGYGAGWHLCGHA